MTLNTRDGRAWSLPGDQSLSNALLVSLRLHSWPVEDLASLMSMLEDWTDADASDLLRDMSTHNDLMQAAIRHLQIVDDILSRTLIAAANGPRRKGGAAVVRRVWALNEKLSKFPVPLWRLSLLKAGLTGDELQLTAALGGLQMDMASRDENLYVNAYRASSWLLQQSTHDDAPEVDSVFDGLVSVVSGRIMPALVWALEVLSTQSKEVWARYLTNRRLYLLDASLGQLQQDLAIFPRPEKTGIPDDAVPILRCKCAQLAYALQRYSGYESPNALRWLKEAQSDPLPELRLSRFRSSVDHTGLSG